MHCPTHLYAKGTSYLGVRDLAPFLVLTSKGKTSALKLYKPNNGSAIIKLKEFRRTSSSEDLVLYETIQLIRTEAYSTE